MSENDPYKPLISFVGDGASAALSIPSLRTAFFVGDLLTKRDVARLQALARNVVVVNMYGTTETQVLFTSN